MYENVYDLLERNKLNDYGRVVTSIMSSWGFTKVLDLAHELYFSIEGDSPPTSDFGIEDYPFLANSNMSAQYDCGCIGVNCRIQRIDKLARFGALYADCLYVPNYFADYEHLKSGIQDDSDKEILRYRVTGDLAILLRLKPLLLSGIARFLPTLMIVCSSCRAELNSLVGGIDSRLNDQIKALEKSFSYSTTAQLQVLPSPPKPKAIFHQYEIHVECDEELFDHGAYVKMCDILPPILRRKIDKDPSTSIYNLTRSEIVRGHVNSRLLEGIAGDIFMLKIHQKRLNLKYLTDRRVDASILRAITDEEEFKDFNEVSASNMAFELPVFQNVPLDTILVIRQQEQDAFFSYRIALNQILKQRTRKTISSEDAKQIYSDVIYPEVKRLDSKVKAIRKSALVKSIKRLGVATGALTLGLCSSSIPPEFKSALLGLGLVQASKAIELIPKAVRPEKEIRNDNFYFLWRLIKEPKI